MGYRLGFWRVFTHEYGYFAHHNTLVQRAELSTTFEAISLRTVYGVEPTTISPQFFVLTPYMRISAVKLVLSLQLTTSSWSETHTFPCRVLIYP